MTPFLKWPGGKRWFISNHVHLLPKEFNRYIEPFLGSGSVFLYLQPENAILGDVNTDLIGAYKGIKHNWRAIARTLRKHHRKHNAAHYYEVRETASNDPIKQAAKFIYLNRTCFNGIYRVNLQGKFNVPMGTKNSVLLAHDNFKKTAQVLSNADIRVSDFELLIAEAGQDDLVFADPPYTVCHNLNGLVVTQE